MLTSGPSQGQSIPLHLLTLMEDRWQGEQEKKKMGTLAADGNQT